MSQRTFYVTTPIYYVNDKPHIGHAYTTILADVLAQYHRVLGVDTFFLTGTDEHGQKVQRAAAAAGISSQQQADRTVLRFQDLWRKLEITNDQFIRTTDQRHKTVVQEILQDLFDRGEIYRDEYDGWYCVSDERFFTEKDLDGGNCPECGRAVEKIREANYFFKMSRYQEWLVRYINENPGFIQPDFRRNETLGFLKKNLNDLCISRPKKRLAWGIELPFDRDYVCYVWFDALVNYISAIGYRRDAKSFEKWWPANYHLIGKDILTTHTVYWPTMLKAIGLPQPRTIFAHGWWLYGNSKMSKTEGNIVDPMEMADKYGVDAFRYFLIAEMSLGQDASFTEESFIRRYNADLANDLGNLQSRILNMVGRYCAGRLPAAAAAALEGAEEKRLWNTIQHAVTSLAAAVDTMKLDAGLASVMAAVRATNRYVEVRRPWALAGQDNQRPLGTVLYTAAESLRVTAALLYPVMPAKMAALRASLGMAQTRPDTAGLAQWGQLEPGTAVAKPAALFPRIDTGAKAPAGGTSTGKMTKTTKGPKPMATDLPAEQTICYEDFAKLQLRTAVIVEAEKVAGADKLLQLQIKLGAERRQIVAGIAEHYSADELIGKTIVVVANLQPAKIRGVESNGMLLAASTDQAVRLITVDGDVASGTSVG